MSSVALEKPSAFALDCQRYIQLHAKQSRLKARLDELKDRIIPELRDGKRSPRDLPYALVLRIRMRTLADWKEALRSHLQLWLKSKEKADAQMEVVQSGFPTEPTEALCVEINKSFAAKL